MWQLCSERTLFVLIYRIRQEWREKLFSEELSKKFDWEFRPDIIGAMYKDEMERMVIARKKMNLDKLNDPEESKEEPKEATKNNEEKP